MNARTFLAAGAGIVAAACLAVSLLVWPTVAVAGTVKFFPSPVMTLASPDTRGGEVMDDKYIWMADHFNGLWRVDRATGTQASSVSAVDGKDWDIWYYDPSGNYPHNPDAGYYIYEAGTDGSVYVMNTSSPSTVITKFNSGGGVAYGIYASDPGHHRLYVATTLGLKVYDISTPSNPTLITTHASTLTFSAVRGLVGNNYIYANSQTNNTTYIYDMSTEATVSTISYGGTNTIRRPWVYVAENGKTYLYTPDSSGNLWISDVTTPTAPQLVTYWKSPAGGVANLPGGSVYVQREYAYVLTSSGNAYGYLYMLDVRNPANPVLVDTLYDPAYGFNDIRIAGSEIDIGAHNGWKQYKTIGWQPDAQVSNTDYSNFVGNGVIETTASASQTKTQYLDQNQTAVYEERFTNTADRRDKIVLQGALTANCTVQYFIDGTDVTAAVLGGTYTTGYLDPGNYVDVTVKLTPSVLSVPGVPYTNTIRATSWMCTGATSPAQDQVAAVALLKTPSIAVAKTDGVSYAAIGQALRYSISYVNTGTADAYNVSVIDVMPVGENYVGASPSPSSVVYNSPSAGKTTITWNAGSLAASTTAAPLVVNASVQTTVTDGSTLVNSAFVNYQDANGSVLGASTADTDTVPGSVLVKTVDKASASVGETLTYTLTPRITGNTPLTDLHVVDPLPAGSSCVTSSVTGSGGTVGAYTPVPAIPGVDVGFTSAMSVGSTFVPQSSDVTVTLSLASTSTVSNVSPNTLGVTGGNYTILSGPTPASASGTSMSFAWRIRLLDAGEYWFTDDADDGGSNVYPPATSASVLSAATGGPNVAAWNLGSTVLGSNGSIITTPSSAGIFALRGNTSKEFSKYDISATTWASKSAVATNVAAGGAMTSDSTGTLYAAVGGSAGFSKYSVSSNTWTPLTNAPAAFGDGACVQYLKVGGVGYVYAMRGGATTTLWRYNIASNSWTTTTTAYPQSVTTGGAMTTDGTYIYVCRGATSANFYRYDPTANTWSAALAAPSGSRAFGAGAALAQSGGYIYAFLGNNYNRMYRYTISSNTWTRTGIGQPLANVNAGGALVADNAGTYLYGLEGGTTQVFWRYTIAGGTWTALTSSNFTGGVSSGAALAFDPGAAAQGRFSQLDISRSFASNSDTFTVTLTLNSNAIESGVSAPSSPTVVSAGGASVVWSAPTLVSADNNIANSGDSVVYSWTGTVGAGAVPGSLTISAKASAPGAWPVATANSLIVCPPLQPKVKGLSGAKVVNDQAALCEGDSGGFDLGGAHQSNLVATSIGGTVGDRVWYDANGNGVQDLSESGLAGVAVTITPPAGVDLGAGNGVAIATVTDSNGNYAFSGLPPATYVVRVNTGTLPAGLAETYDPDATKDSSASVTIASSETHSDVDFGYDDSASIGNRVWKDTNGNGVLDAGESGIASVTVRLYADTNGNGVIDDGEPLKATTVTDASGNYLFSSLPGGKYVVVVDETDPDMPAGYVATTTNPRAVTLAAGAARTDVNFGYTAYGSIGNTVWYDANGNGIQDAGEVGMSGVQMVLTSKTATYYATTDINGGYLFSGLTPDTYTVSVNSNTLPSGYAQTHDPDSVLDSSHVVVLGAGQNFLSADFGYNGAGAIGDCVWRDTDGDRIQEPSESGIASVAVTLYKDTNGNGQADPGEPLLATTMTDAQGYYTFGGLIPQDYVVSVDKSDSHLSGLTNTTLSAMGVTITPGLHVTTADFGFGPFGQVGDFVWADSNGNGVADPGEAGLPNILVTLTPPHGVDVGAGPSMPVTTTTDAFGAYRFQSLPPGGYGVSIGAPAGYAQTYDPDGTLDNQNSFTLAAGEYKLDRDFGYRATSSIGDRVWLDTNGNGIQDAGEPGLAGVRVFLYQDANLNGYFDDGEPFVGLTSTDASGNYSFQGLPPGQYLAMINRDDYPVDGGGNAYGPTTPVTQVVPLAANQYVTTADFGFGPFASIGKTVFYDANGNNIQDTGTTDEYGIGGVKVTLFAADASGTPKGSAIATAVTDSYGHYFFSGLVATGTTDFAVQVDTSTIPVGLTVTTPNPYAVLNLGATASNQNANFACRGTSTIGDYVFNDINGNGVQDGGELGIPNVHVELWRDTNGNGALDDGIGGDQLVSSKVTASDGSYSFQNVNNGTVGHPFRYFVRVVSADPNMPSGYTATTANPLTEDISAPNTIVHSANFGFGLFGSLGDFVWNDLNHNGIQDDGEPGLAGVRVVLSPPGGINLGNGSGVASSTVTDSGGHYVFRRLPAGFYNIQIDSSTVATGLVPTLANVGTDDTIDSDSVGGASVPVNVTTGANSDLDFGYYLQDIALSLQKTGTYHDTNANGLVDTGDQITYSFTVHNTGSVTLTNVTLTDPKVIVGGGPIPALVAGAFDASSFTATYTLSAADVLTRSVANTATATGTFGGLPYSATGTCTVSLPKNPSIKLVKTATLHDTNSDGRASAGDQITYGFAIHNAGDVALTNVTLADPRVTVTGGPLATLSVGATDSSTFSATHTLTQADVDAGSYTNTATASGDFEGQTYHATSSATTSLTALPLLSLGKTADRGSFSAVGDKVVYTYHLTNTGNVTLRAPWAVHDDRLSVAAPSGDLAPGASVDVTSGYTITQADIDAGSVTNNASATATFGGSTVGSNADSVTLFANQTPAIALSKAGVKVDNAPLGVDNAGDRIDYTFTIRNTGNTSLVGVWLQDDPLGQSWGPVTLAPSQVQTYTASHTVTQADVDAGSFVNTATVTSQFLSAHPSATDTATTSFTQSPVLHLTKSADKASLSSAGQQVVYTYHLTNTGNVTLRAPWSIADDKTAVVAPASDLAPGASLDATSGYTVTQADIDAGSLTNDASATATFGSSVHSNSDSVTIPVTQSPSVTLSKTATYHDTNSDGRDSAGDTITYAFAIHNAGNTTLSNLGIADAGASLSGSPIASLAPNATDTATFSASHVLTQADIDAGAYSNTATLTAHFGAGSYTATSSVTTTVTQSPTLSLSKSADLASFSTAGQTIVYTYHLTNTGNVTLHAPWTVSDDRLTVAAPAGDLAPGASTIATGAYVTKQSDVDAGSVTNVASATATFGGVTVHSNADTVTVSAAAAPAVSLLKTATYHDTNSDGRASPGDVITYGFAVTNAGGATLSAVSIDDTAAPVVGGPIALLAPGATDSLTFSASHVVTQADVDAGSVANTATVRATFGASTYTDTASVTTTLPAQPGLTLDKTADKADVSAAGERIVYTYHLTNTGNVTLHAPWSVSDDHLAVAAPASDLAPGASVDATAGYTVTQADFDAGSITNVASASATFDGAEVDSNQDSVTVTALLAPGINLSKIGVKVDAVPISVDNAGDQITYTMVVTNTGNTTLFWTQVLDPTLGFVSPMVSLAPSQSATFTSDYTVTQADIDAGSIENSATAIGMGPGLPVWSLASATTTFTQSPSVALDKSGTYVDADSNGHPSAGDRVDYTFAVHNTGNVTLSGITLADAGASLSGSSIASLAPGATDGATFSASHTLTQADIDAGTYTNTATATARFNGGDYPASDGDTQTFARTPALSLGKSADKSSVATAGERIVYTYHLTNTGNVTLHAPWSVGDDHLAVTAPTSDLAPGASVDATAAYTVTQADIDSGAITNNASATATFDGAGVDSNPATCTVPANQSPGFSLDKTGTYHDSNSDGRASAGDTITYAFRVLNHGNTTLSNITLADPNAALVGGPIATLAPGAEDTATFSASHVLTQADIDAGTFSNTATATAHLGASSYTATGGDTQNFTRTPSLALDKTADRSTVDAAGDVVTYTYALTNTGNVTLHAPWSIADDRLSVGAPTTDLAPGASVAATAAYVVTQADIDAGAITNNASATATFGATTVKSNTDSVTVTANQAPSIGLSKLALKVDAVWVGVDSVGDSIDYTFVVTNTGNTTLSSVWLNDARLGYAQGPLMLGPSQTQTFTASYALTQADIDAGSVLNTASVTGQAGATPVSNSASVTTTFTPVTALDLVKTVDKPSVSAAGEKIVYTYHLTNAGNVTLHAPWSVLDDKTSVPAPVGDLAPSSSVDVTASYTVTQADIDAGFVTNNASATATFGGANVDSNSRSVTVPAIRTPHVTLQKTGTYHDSNADGRASAGDTITYAFTVANTGNTTLHSLTLADAGASVTGGPIAALAPGDGDSVTFSASHVLTQADVDAGAYSNAATVTAHFNGGDYTAADTDTRTLPRSPSLSLSKSADKASVSAAGDAVVYTYHLTNTGNVTLGAPWAVGDDRTSVVAPTSALAPGASVDVTAGYTITQADMDAGSVTNVASATATFNGTDVASNAASKTVSAVQSPALKLSKSADKASVSAAGDRIVYTYHLTNTGNVTLQAPWNLHDDRLSVPAPTSSLAPGASLDATAGYTVTQADIDAGSITNNASATATFGGTSVGSNEDSLTVTADQNPDVGLSKIGVKVDAAPLGVDSAGDSIDYSLVVTNTGNTSLLNVWLLDARLGLNLGPLVLAPSSTQTFSASYTVTQADIDAGSVLNTATVAGGILSKTASATASVTTTFTQSPAVVLKKTADKASFSAAGTPVTYSYALRNAGNVTLHAPWQIADDRLSVTAPTGDLAPGAIVTVTAGYSTTQGELDAGGVTNVASATATFNAASVRSNTDTVTVLGVQSPSVTLSKTGTYHDTNSDGRDSAGDTITYAFAVHNAGNVTLTNLSLADIGATLVGGPLASLAPGATDAVTFTASHVLTQADVDSGSYVNTASVQASFGASHYSAQATDTQTFALSPALTLTKSADTSTVSAAGDKVVYTYHLTNTGNVTLHAPWTVADDRLSVTAPTGDLAPNASVDATAGYTVSQADIDSGSITNVASATATFGGAVHSNTASKTVNVVQSPKVTLSKTGTYHDTDSDGRDSAGDTITYAFSVHNAGNVTLSGITISDPKVGVLGGPLASLAPGATDAVTFTASHVLTQADVDSGSYVNTASVDASFGASHYSAQATDTQTFVLSPALALTKSADRTSFSAPGTPITYSYKLVNTGNVTLHAPWTVADDRLSVTAPNTDVSPGASVTVSAGYVTTQADLDAGGVTNVASATATFDSAPVHSNTDTVTVTGSQSPGIDLSKLGLKIDAVPVGVDNAGDAIEYTLVVTNTGNTTLSGIWLADASLSFLQGPLMLAPSSTQTFTADYTVTQADLDLGSHVNTATVSGQINSTTVSSAATATTAFTQAPALALTKSADTSTVSAAGDKVVYTYHLTNTGNVTLHAPWTVADDRLSVTAPTGDLAPNASVDATAGYTASQADIDSGSITNVASATATFGGAVHSNTASKTVNVVQSPKVTLSKTGTYHDTDSDGRDSAGDTITYAFSVHNAGNVTLSGITISDPKVGVLGGPLASLAPGATDAVTFAASHVLTQADVDSGSYVNTASVDASFGASHYGAEATDTQTFAHAPAVSVRKSLVNGQDAFLQAGQPATFTVTVTNVGNSTLTSGAVDDDWSAAQLTYASASPAPVLLGSDSANFTLPTLAPGQTATYTVAYRANSTGYATNTATTIGVADSLGVSAGSQSDSAHLTVTAPAVSATKTLSPPSRVATVVVGQDIGFTLTVANSGDTTIATADVVDSWDAAMLAFGSSDAGPSHLTSGSATFTVTGLAPGATRSIEVTLTGVAQGHTQNLMSVSGSDDNGDPVSSTSAVPLTVKPITHPTLTLTKQLASGQNPWLQVGKDVSYDIVVRNSGDTTIVTGDIHDTWTSSELTFVDSSPAPLSHGAGQADFPLPLPMAPGAVTTITARFTVEDQPLGKQISNYAGTNGVHDSFDDTVTASGGNALVNVTAPGLAVSKSLAPWQGAWAAMGDPVAFRVTFTNTGDTTITTLPALDTFDSDALTFSAANSAPQTSTAGLLAWADLGPLAPGATRDLDTTFTVTGMPSRHTATNSISVGGALDEHGYQLPVRQSASTVNLADPGVRVSKHLSSGQSSSVFLGEPVSYDIDVTNSGNTTLTTVPLSDLYPNLLEFQSADPAVSSNATDASGGTLTWNDITSQLGDLDPGQTGHVTVHFSAKAKGVVANSAVVQGAADAAERSVPTTSSSNADLTIVGPAPAALLKSAEPTAGTIVMPGDVIHYTLSFENTHSVTIPSVLVADKMPAAVSYVPSSMHLTLGGSTISLTDQADADNGLWDASGKAVQVTVGDLSAGATGCVTFDAKVLGDSVSRPGVFNTFTLKSGEATAQVSNQVVHPVDPFDITKTAKDLNGGKLQAGDQILWTIVVRNTGLVPTTHVVVTDPLPAGVTYVPGSITGKGANASDRSKMVWDVGAIPVGGVITLTFKTTVDSGLKPGSAIRNFAYVAADGVKVKASDDPRTKAVGDSTMVRTGGNDWIWLLSALALLTSGCGLLGTRFVLGRTNRAARPRVSTGVRLTGYLAVVLLFAAVLVAGAANADEIRYDLGLPDPGATFAVNPTLADAGMVSGSAGFAQVSASSITPGRLDIPSARIHVPVGTVEASALKHGAWLQVGSAEPGQPGNTVLAGHRMNGIFILLNKVKKGDKITLTWRGKTYTYQVADIHDNVNPTDVTWMQRAGRDRLTLYTCLPRWSGDKRVVVIANPVKR